MKKLLLRHRTRHTVIFEDRVDVDGIKWPLRMERTVYVDGERKVVTFRRTGQWVEQRRLYSPMTDGDHDTLVRLYYEQQEVKDGAGRDPDGGADVRVDRPRGRAARNPWA